MDTTTTLDELVAQAVDSVRFTRYRGAIDELAAHAARDGAAPEVSAALADLLVQILRRQWLYGWQPADLAHYLARKRKGAGPRHVCADGIALDAHSYIYSPGADPVWLAQVEAVTARRPPPERTTLLGGWGGDVRMVVTTLSWLGSLMGQPRLCVPPAEWGQEPPSRGPGGARGRARLGADPKMTERVRALLAKAESTTFPDEAEAFTAKAQELIARHAIDLALLGTDRTDRLPEGDAVGRRVLIDDPYGKAKSMLLTAIAKANGCKTVWSNELGVSTVFGAPNDLDAVELLFASLLTQATAAMTTATASPSPSSASPPASDNPAWFGRLGGRAELNRFLPRGLRSTPRHHETASPFGTARATDSSPPGENGGDSQSTGGRARSNGNGAAARSFRQSFLVAYAVRIGERLQEATNVAVDEARAVHGDNVLPVLAARDAEAEAACATSFPALRKQRISTSNPEGWNAGRAAADRARFGPDKAIPAG
jgi:hypothetical protein